VERVLGQLTAGESGASLAARRALEVGCGDGKVGRALARAGIGAYVGVDGSDAMLARARRYSSALAPGAAASLGWLRVDLTEAGWAQALPPQPFDWILAFGVFHHLPGAALRAEVLRALAGRLAPGGRLAMSNWQFMRSARLRQRIRPWSAVGLADGDVEPGDYVLAWERKGAQGLRHVHVLDESEARQMAADAGLRVVEVFRSDGVTADLADYVVLCR
jgi:SAM-dependent methyltransferase